MIQITASDIRWLRLALVQAEQAPHAQWRVGAALVRGGSILSTGFNRYRNSPAQVELSGVSYHAEEAAIRKAGNVKGATLYVARITRSGALGTAKPCERCQELLWNSGVHTVVWTTPKGLMKDRLSVLATCMASH
jgi:tRNA(Arg) A34 adenosine deaminase TadA